MRFLAENNWALWAVQPEREQLEEREAMLDVEQWKSVGTETVEVKEGSKGKIRIMAALSLTRQHFEQ